LAIRDLDAGWKDKDGGRKRKADDSKGGAGKKAKTKKGKLDEAVMDQARRDALKARAALLKRPSAGPSRADLAMQRENARLDARLDEYIGLMEDGVDFDECDFD
jgi:hypothetical protein